MRYLTLEIHDVSPTTLPEVKEIARRLEAMGHYQYSLLAVPNWQDELGRCWDLSECSETVDWLQSKRSQGCEIVQHGFTHRAPSRPPAGIGPYVMHHWFSRGCAEFAHLDGLESRRRLLAGRRILRQAGFTSDGFIAPAWQQSEDSIAVLRELGFRYTAFLNHVLPLTQGGSRVDTPAVTFAAANAWVDRSKRVVMRILERRARPLKLLRMALHPEDLTGAIDFALGRLARLTHHRPVTTYERWLTA